MSRLIDAENIRIKPEFMHDVCGMAMIRVEDVVRILNEQPTIQPKTGHWIIYTVSPFDGEDVKCSECGRVACAPYWDYCPNCGARMDGVTE